MKPRGPHITEAQAASKTRKRRTPPRPLAGSVILSTAWIRLMSVEEHTGGSHCAGPGADNLVWPNPEQLTVPLYQSRTLKLRKALAVFVGLGQPHADHSIAAGVPE